MLLTLASWAHAQAVAEERPWRLGIHHLQPRLCTGEEPAQRDLRVLRLAFGLGRTPAQWRGLPWFYTVRPALPASAESPLPLVLDTAALWGHPPYWWISGHPDFAFAGVPDRLAAWRAEVTAGVPGLSPAPFPTLAPFTVAPDGVGPFLGARLTGSNLLPAHTPLPTPAAGAPPPTACRSWPAGTTYEGPAPGRSYALRGRSGADGPAYALTAHSRPEPLWEALGRARLDAALLEGRDLTGVPPWAERADLVRWALRPGGQQVVLRIRPGLAERLDRAARTALSLATPRDEMAALAPGPDFVPAGRFLEPLLPLDAPPAADALARDTRAARRHWLRQAERPEALRLVVPAHPLLEQMAYRLRAQWQRTLNVAATVDAEPVDQFMAAARRPETDLVLDVVDVDDGSLQALWREALQAAGVAGADALPPGGTLPADRAVAWEQALREALPYLPLLQNVHYLAVRTRVADEALPALCPACRAYRPGTRPQWP